MGRVEQRAQEAGETRRRRREEEAIAREPVAEFSLVIVHQSVVHDNHQQLTGFKYLITQTEISNVLVVRSEHRSSILITQKQSIKANIFGNQLCISTQRSSIFETTVTSSVLREQCRRRRVR